MRALLGMLWLALACSSVHATLSKSDAKKAASKTLQEKVGGLGNCQRADHHTSLPTGGCAPGPGSQLRAGSFTSGRPAPSLSGLQLAGLGGSSFWCWGPRAGLPHCARGSARGPVPSLDLCAPPCFTGRVSRALPSVAVSLCGFPGGPRGGRVSLQGMSTPPDGLALRASVSSAGPGTRSLLTERTLLPWGSAWGHALTVS